MSFIDNENTLRYFDGKIQFLLGLGKYDCVLYQLANPWDDLLTLPIQYGQRIQIPNTIFFVYEKLRSN